MKSVMLALGWMIVGFILGFVVLFFVILGSQG